MEAIRRRRWVVLIGGAGALALLLAVAAGAGPKTSKPIKVGYDPLTIAAGDLNQDGKDDLVVPDFNSTNPAAGKHISILAGKGNGKFKLVKTLDAPSQPDGVAIGRVGSGGEPDLILTGFTGDGELMVFEGKSGFGFKPAKEIALTGSPRKVVTDDFDGDKKRDLAVSRQTAGDTVVLLQRKNGKFAPPKSYPGGFGAEILVTRLDKDDFPDLITLNPTAGKLLTMAGTKKGKFKAPHAYRVPKGTTAITYADFDQDHINDLAVTGSSSATKASAKTNAKAKVSILLGKRGGNFEAAHEIAIGPASKVDPASITAAQLDGDHDPDLVVGSRTTGGSGLLVLFGEHKSGFSKATRINAGGAVYDSTTVRVGNRDKVPFVIAKNNAKGAVSVLGDG